MEEDIKDVSEAKEEVMNEDSLVHFEFGDLYIKCSCGHEEKFIPGIEGIQVVLPATNKHNLKIVCSKCGKATRVGYEIIDKKKYRVCKKCGAKI